MAHAIYSFTYPPPPIIVPAANQAFAKELPHKGILSPCHRHIALTPLPLSNLSPKPPTCVCPPLILLFEDSIASTPAPLQTVVF